MLKLAMVAIVTGGSKGIGFAIARALLGRGMQVTITGRNEADLRHAAEKLAGAEKLHTVSADVRDIAGAKRIVDETVSTFGGLDVLVNNAGVGKFATVADMSPETWRDVIDTNLTGVFYCTHAALPELRRRGGGYIINISSLASKNPFTGGAAYCASKSGLNAFSEALMQEVRYDNIRVSYVLPGSVSTGFGDRGSSGEADPSTELGAGWKLAPEDVARVVMDLISHEARSLASCVELRPSRPRKG
ncbi:MAG TPA: SDR family oxidoreductase [Vicinamibacterales bacterium]|nr:SDR family oxidoreductase [Vicinamibacterales bacterium]